jgi:YfiR/HmsC-like
MGRAPRTTEWIRRRLRRLVASVTLLVATLLPWVHAAEEPDEGAVKAAFVLNFMRFVAWPASAFPSAEAPLHVSVLGADPVAASLSSLDGKLVSSRPVVVRMVSALADLGESHVLYVGASEQERLSEVLLAVHGRPTLVIADFEGFAGRGGTIGFIRRDDRIGFEVNEESARRAGLQVSAKLLYLGKSVRSGSGGER